MTKKREIYRCSVCGNMVEVLDAAAGTMVCCAKPMTLLEGNTQDASHEKHVPVIEQTEVLRRELHPGDKPEALFVTSQTPLMVRAYCNLHGLWTLKP